MKRVSRARLRGQPLDPLCKLAHTTTGEYGPDDKRVFCYGVYDAMTDEPEELCVKCGAFVRNEAQLELQYARYQEKDIMFEEEQT